MSTSKQAPPVRLPRKFLLPAARHWQLRNGLAVTAVEGASRPILRLELLFHAGRPYESAPGVGRATNLMLAEGSRQRSASEIEAYFEYYGTNLILSRSMDTASVTIYTILPHLESVLPMLAEVVLDPAFKADDLRRFCKRSKQSLREALTEADTIAYRQLTDGLFGPDHFYGYDIVAQHYDELQCEQLQNFHQQAYTANNAHLLLAGQIDAKTEALLDQYLGQLPLGNPLPSRSPFPQIYAPGIKTVRRPKAQQTLIRRARLINPQAHHDLPGLEVLNTLLGGYFGSRLMQNIREEKGYTYNIDSSLENLRYASYLSISADVANDNLEAVNREIDHEIDKLQQDPIPMQEMEMLRAYLLGVLMNEIDGPLNIIERYQQAVMEKVDPIEYNELIHTVESIRPQQLQDLAQRYLGKAEEEIHVAVGGAV